MKELKVKDMLQICNGKLICGNEEEICEHFVKDTNEVTLGDVYVGIKGEKVDGSLFYEEALKNGARICLLEEIPIQKETYEKYPNTTIIVVKNSIEAIQKLATYKRSLYDIPVIGITGSVGKTSTKDIIGGVVSTSYKVRKTYGNYNNHIGLPLTILGLKDHTALVVEMGMNHLGELRKLTNIAKPTICVITNVGTAHIGNLGSRENILKAKLEILEGLTKEGMAIINNDNDLLHNWNMQNKEYKVKSFGIENKSDIIAQDISINEHESNFTSYIYGEKTKVEVPVTGKHFVYNAICAICVGEVLNISKQNILKGIKEFELSKNRMEILKNEKEVTIINDCYNASFDSMKASLEVLSKIEGRRKIAVLGDILELGEYSKKIHEDVGNEVTKNNIDILITVGEASKNIAKIAIQNGMNRENVYEFERVEEAIEKVKEEEKQGDVMLVKASNGMNFKKIVEEVAN